MVSRAICLCALVASTFGLIAAPAWADSEATVETNAQPVERQSNETVRPSPPLTADEQTLLAIQEEGRRQVDLIVHEMGTLPPAAQQEPQARIVQIKRDTELRFLTALAQIARAHGDEVTALQAETVIDQMLHPAAPSDQLPPQSPDKARTTEGGKP